MKSRIDEVDEMLRLGRSMGRGERYLMLYEGQLALTNRTGLSYWPRGRRQMIAIFDAADCARGLTVRQWDRIFENLRKLEYQANSNETECDGCVASELSRPMHPT